MMTYTIQPNIGYLLNDSPEHLDFHVRTGDYLSFVATLLGFIEESLSQCSAVHLSEEQKNIARELRNDLQYVQSRYKIIPRNPGESEPVRPSGNILPE